MDPELPSPQKRILIQKAGPYRVEGGIPLFVYRQEMSPYGEPLAWNPGEEITPARHPYLLCRCGHSKTFPFCDGSHTACGFTGIETGPTARALEPTLVLQAPDGPTIRKFQPLCMVAGFCILREAGIDDLSEFSDNPADHQRAIKMVEDCPAGALTYSLTPEGPDVEQDLPMQIALTQEGCEGEMINGPFWVMGGIPIFRSDHVPFLPRNRVTLCNCGRSSIMPLCDGTHRSHAEAQIKKRKRGQA